MIVVAPGLSQVPRGRRISPKSVLPDGHRTHVVRPDAGTVVAHEVVEDQTVGDRTVDTLPVDLHGLGGLVAISRLVSLGSDAGQSVSVFVEVLRPNPTAGLRIDGVVRFTSVVPMNESSRFPLDPAVAGVVPSPDARVLTTSACTETWSFHEMVLSEVGRAA